jgi:hypothetical protein
MRRRLFILLIGLGALTSPVGCGGQRALEGRVERDGELVLKTLFGVSDKLPPEAAWQHLTGRHFKAVGPITPDPGGAQTATLRGKIRIELRHAGTHFASADVQELRLTKVPGTDNDWEIPRSEVERTARAAGFKPE